MPQVLWYKQPASAWVQALPLGNGRLGAMVFGGVTRERLALNEDSLWSGYPKQFSHEGKAAIWKKAQALTFKGQAQQAEALLEADFLSDYSQAYLPLGDLLLDFGHPAESGGYRRELCLDQALSRVTYVSGGVTFTREAYISAPDQVLVLELNASKPAGLAFSARLTSPFERETSLFADGFTLLGLCPSNAWPNYVNHPQPLSWDSAPERTGIRFCAAMRIISDGRLTASDGALHLSGASRATLLVACRSNFAGWDKAPELAGVPYSNQAQADLNLAVSRLDTIRQRHITEQATWFSRTRLRLAGTSLDELPTDARLARFYQHPEDLGLVTLLFDYGRYLLIASSRPGSQPANLQGIWNESTAPPWSSNYTTNINLQMNYWPALPLNLMETQQPLFTMLAELAQAGRATARDFYGAGGFVCHHNSDLWRHSLPVGGGGQGRADWGYWPHAGAWLCAHLSEHWRYTRDLAFLKATAWPICREAARFYLDTLTEDAGGKLVFCPDTSPENTYLRDGRPQSLSTSTAMTAALVRGLFQDCLELTSRLDLTQEDAAFAARLEAALPRLKGLKAGSDGRLLEWDGEWPETEPAHRHLSHLLALYPGHLITLEDTPEMAKACRLSLLARTNEGTGWSLGWKICLWARLRDGEQAWDLIKKQLRLVPAEPGPENPGGGSYENLLGAHPPFQIDGNFGLCAGIAGMLLQSRPEGLWLLPALPGAWDAGSAEGLRAYDGLTVSLFWEAGRLRRCELTASIPAETTLMLPDGQRVPVRLAAGQSTTITP